MNVKFKLLVPILFFIASFLNMAVTMEYQRNSFSGVHLGFDVIKYDPPFYKLTMKDKRIIYILGSIHTLPLKAALTSDAYNELDKIAKQSPIYIDEHTASNEENLKHIDKAKLENKWINDIKFSEKESWININKEKINIELDNNGSIQVSNRNVEELEGVKLYLAAPTFAIHIGAFLKKKFGSFEHDIQLTWKDHFKLVKHLESHEQAIKALENDTLSEERYIKWIEFMMVMYKISKNHDTDLESQNFMRVRYLNSIKQYNHMNFYNKGESLNKSTVERNYGWLTTFKEYRNIQNNFLIVVGQGHLEGPKNFLTLLLEEMKKDDTLEKAQRYGNGTGWVNFNFDN